jgi:hypothetical protein
VRNIFDNYICIHSNDTLTKDKHMKAFLSLSNGGLIMLIAILKNGNVIKFYIYMLFFIRKLLCFHISCVLI